MGRIYKGTDFVLTFSLLWLLGVYIHEWSHALMGQALGWSATIGFPHPFAGWALFPEWQLMSFSSIVLIALAGGLATGLLFYAWAYFTDDYEHDMALYYFGSMHIIYAFFEVAYILHYISVTILGVVPAVLALIPLLILEFSKSDSALNIRRGISKDRTS